MNAVANIRDAGRAPEAIGGKLGSRLADIRTQFLAVFVRADNLLANLDRRAIEDADWLRGDARWAIGRGDAEHRAYFRRRAEGILFRAPVDPDDAAYIRHAIETDPHPNQTRILIGLMIDAYPNARPHNMEIYFETLVSHALAARHPPAVVAAACDLAVSTRPFPPTVSEFLAACKERAGRLYGALRAAELAAQLPDLAHAALEAGAAIAKERDEDRAGSASHAPAGSEACAAQTGP